ncbi:MAG: chorismate-binding protein, partial [Myxococcota bacterium]|nr:chorismate-binding protein [Myxococcota bacterium]
PTYRAAVRSALEHIATGDVYQVCLAWEQVMDGMVNPVAAWHLLRQDNPAARAALLRAGDRWLLSNSPETFLDVSATPQGLHARSVPIKGTVPVSAGPEGRAWLGQSAKEIAELTMIVDLVRNDLGRVASPGTVRAGPRTLRRCGDLIHAEQEIEARLRPGVDAVDAMAAAFPPGSVTGAPKIRAMELIHALERASRGPYTGVLGLWGDDGSANSSVLIRTASIEPSRSRYHIGAGIVADSVPDREWEETCQKGAALGAALARAIES